MPFSAIAIGLENFDGVGRYRVLDNGIPIDPSGNLDDVDFDGPETLALALANHPDYARCIVAKTYAYATGRHVEGDDKLLVGHLLGRFNADQRRLLSLFREVALSDGFRFVGEVKQ